MSKDFEIGAEQDRLKCRLLPAEERGYVERLESKIVFARYPAKTTPAKGTIMLLHGVGSNSSRWEEFVERTDLTISWNVVRLDLRGHAASDSRAKGTLEEHAKDIVAILDSLTVEKAVLVGHSLGAHVALKFAQDYSGRLEALVLVDPLINEALTPATARKRSWRPFLRTTEAIARTLNTVGIRRTLPYYSLRAHDQEAREMLAKGREALEEFIKEYSSPLKDLGHIHVADYTRDLLEISRISPDIQGLAHPVLVVASTAGRVTSPEKVRQWAAALPNGTMETVPCVHWPFTECPEKISEVVETWLKKL